MPSTGTTETFAVNKTATDSAYSVGARVRVSSSTTPAVDYFEGIVTAYAGTTMSIAVDIYTNTGTLLSSWTINIAAESYLSTNLKSFTTTVLNTITLPAGTLPYAFSPVETILNLTPSGLVVVTQANIDLVCQVGTNNSNNVTGGGTIAPYNKLFVNVFFDLKKNGGIIKSQVITVIDNAWAGILNFSVITSYSPGDIFTVDGYINESSITLTHDIVLTSSNAFLSIQNY